MSLVRLVIGMKYLTLFLPGGGRFTPALYFKVSCALNSCGRGLKPLDFSYKLVRSTLARRKNSGVTIFFSSTFFLNMICNQELKTGFSKLDFLVDYLANNFKISSILD